MLTELQEEVLTRLHKAGHHMLAGVTKEFWERGESHYIDRRTKISANLKRDYNRANEQAVRKTAQQAVGGNK